MYDEEKTLNFTTQNSFLHYGRKGMKWYKNIFGQRDENGKRISRRQAEFNKKSAEMQADFDQFSKKTEENYNRQAGYNQAEYNRFVKDNEDQMNRLIAEESQKIYDSAYDGIKKASEKLDKFVDAFDSIQDMDDKYTTKLYKKYIYDITKASKDFNDSLKKVTQVVRKSNPDLADTIENMYMLDMPKVDADPATIRGYMWNFTNKKEAAYRFLDDSAGMTNEIYGGGLNVRPGYSNNNKFLTTDEKADKYLNRKK